MDNVNWDLNVMVNFECKLLWIKWKRNALFQIRIFHQNLILNSRYALWTMKYGLNGINDWYECNNAKHEMNQ